MADYIPFITGEDSGNLVKKVYSDADISGGPKELDRKRGVLSEALRGSRYATSRWGSRAK